MAKKKKSSLITTFLGPDACIDGTLEFQGTIKIDGKVKGKIKGTDSTVIVGENAHIDADMTVDTAIVMGEVNGTIHAMEKIEVHPPGRVMGDICAPVISIGSGATFNGNCGMKCRDVAGRIFSESGDEQPGQKKMKPV